MPRFDVFRASSLIPLSLSALLLASCGGAMGQSATAQGAVFAIVHASNPLESVEAGTLRNFYYGRRSEWPHGTVARPLLLPEDSPSGRALFERVLDTSNASFRRLWQTRQLSGQGMAPSEAQTPRAMIRRVAGSRGSVGVLLESDLPDPVPPQVRAIPIR